MMFSTVNSNFAIKRFMILCVMIVLMSFVPNTSNVSFERVMN